MSTLFITGPDIFSNLSQIFLIGGCIVSVIGATNIYFKWNAAHADDLEKEITIWVGGIVFLISISVCVKLLFEM
jgi:hypothetical protein